MFTVCNNYTRYRITRSPELMEPEDARAPFAPARPPAAPSRGNARLMLVDFRSGESVAQHPEIAPLLSDGWLIQSAVPRMVEARGTKLLVVLSRSKAPAFATA